eukprot:NODE_379_length_9676_cov_0.362222.p5 type:complete len:133 gc:universal NODE_379_length_9676_cov_0.362222:1075-1473(+)
MLLNFSQYSALVDLLSGYVSISDNLCLLFYGVSDTNAKKRLNRLRAQFSIQDNCLKSLPGLKIVLPMGAHDHVIYQTYFKNGTVPLTKSWLDFKSKYETHKSKCGLLRCDFDMIYSELGMAIITVEIKELSK